MARSKDSQPFPPAAGNGLLSRRGFLQAAGFAAGGSLLASCTRAPVERAIPFLIQPEGVVPGRALFYASTCAACPAACGLLMKVREGRPVKLAGNPDHPFSRGGLCAQGQAQLLELYDALRLTAPRLRGREVSWEEMDEALVAAFRQARKAAILTATVTSPSLKRLLAKVQQRFPHTQVVVYDPLPASALLQAHEALFGVRAVPRPHLERAKVSVSFGADFLGTWLAPVAFTQAWRQGRQPENGQLSYHAQLEPVLSLTGTKADEHIRIHPAEMAPALAELVRQLHIRAGHEPLPAPEVAAPLAARLRALAEKLWRVRGQAVVLCGSQDLAAQKLACAANELLQAYGSLLDLANPVLAYQGDEAAAQELLRQLEAGEVQAVLVAGVNPVYDLPEGERWAEALKRAGFAAVWASHEDETAEGATALLPAAHPLESWGDAEPVLGLVGLQQPAIGPLFQARSLLEVLARLAGESRSARQLVEETFAQELAEKALVPGDFAAALERGFVEVKREPYRAKPFAWEAMPAVSGVGRVTTTLVLYPTVGLGSGQHAHNPLLQELPDPITKLTWDNAALMAPELAERHGLQKGDVVRLRLPQGEVSLPAWVLPGLHPQVVAVALGYGRRTTARFAGFGPRWLQARDTVGPNGLVGVRVTQLCQRRQGLLAYELPGVAIEPTGQRAHLASTQEHHRLEVPEHLKPAVHPERDIVRETTWESLSHKPAASHRKLANLWPDDFPTRGHRWAMAIDLNACTGCAACVVACQVENNVPVVGKDEVARHREMHWLRIDRYFVGEGEELRVVHQPMLCQQCGHAPCETVCPVLATVHSEEGLNQQVYNRCVGTRYCANNCPYKVRRFNWFTYEPSNPLAAAALNPDVTVRTRGVMEKCTFCVQRIEAARIEAQAAGKPFTGREVRTACQDSCPAQAIVFGDLNDAESSVARAWASGRSYRVLEELGVEPAVAYLTVVRQEASHG